MGALRKLKRSQAKAQQKQLDTSDDAIHAIINRHTKLFIERFGRKPEEGESAFFDPASVDVPLDPSPQMCLKEFYSNVEELAAGGKVRLELIVASALCGKFVYPSRYPRTSYEPIGKRPDDPEDALVVDSLCWGFRLVRLHGPDSVRRAVLDHCRLRRDRFDEASALEMMIELGATPEEWETTCSVLDAYTETKASDE